MREHLYRGKRIDNGEWAYGYVAKFRNVHNQVYTAILQIGDDETKECSVQDLVPVLDDTICEYIGLTDDNGNKVFEGDILDDRDNMPHYVIVFDNGFFKVPSMSEYKKEDFYTETADEFFFSQSNVIGNIYDNPDLLDDKNKND